MKLGGFPERIWRGRWLQALFLVAALPLLTTFIWRLLPPLAGAGEAALVYTPVPLAADDPERRDVGRLHFLGGWTMNSPDARLGGVSALRVEGGQATAVSDIGMIITFPLPGVSGAPRIRFEPIHAGQGANPDDRRLRDSEGLWLERGSLWVTFERQNAIRRYDRATLNPEAGAQPARMHDWRPNSGPEAIVRLADGRFLVIEEGRDNGSTSSEAVLFAGDPALPDTPSATVTYRRPAGYRATDAALLPDGRILILNRSLDQFQLSAKLVLADPRSLSAGGTLAGEEVATLAAPLLVENMEGLAVAQENGRTIVWLVSDNDFMRLFRHTLLMKFELRL
jgi:hypothetical protein